MAEEMKAAEVGKSLAAAEQETVQTAVEAPAAEAAEAEAAGTTMPAAAAEQNSGVETAALTNPSKRRGRPKGRKNSKKKASASPALMSDVELLEAVEAAAKSGKPDERLAPPQESKLAKRAAKRGRPAHKDQVAAAETAVQPLSSSQKTRERVGFCSRATTETAIEVQINLDGDGSSDIDTGIGFLNHMLTLLARHGFLDLSVQARGDLDVDCHHTIEDCGIVLGTALKDALGTKAGIHRYGNCFIPMDEALAQVCLDFSGRPYIVFDADLPIVQIGNYDSEMTEEFFRALAVASGMTLHIRVLYGKNLHHMIEAIFKAFARALSEAVTYDPRVHGVMSSKGIL